MKRFLAKKHIRQDRLQEFVTLSDFNGLISEEHASSLGSADDHLQIDISQMYYM